MRTAETKPIRSIYVCLFAACILALSSFAYAQDDQDQPPDQAPPAQASPAQPGTWQHFSNPPQNQTQPPAPVVDAPPQQQGNYPPPQGNYPPPQGNYPPPQGNYPPPQGNYPPPQGQGNYYPPQGNQQPESQGNYQPPPPIPPQLTLRTGTFITVRSNQFLSSDRNQAGDAFTATLAQPLVVDSVVVAEPGETIGGRVVEAKKAGMVKGVSRLALQLTSLTLINGQPLQIQTQLSGRNGPTSNGRDAAAVAGTTGLGAAVGASVARPWDRGNGAAIGAGAGAAVGILGVLLTRGRPTEVMPETMLTFETAAPVTINTTQGTEAFHWVGPDDYPQQANNHQGPPRRPCNGYGCQPPPPYAYGYGYGYGWPGYYPYWGPSAAFWWGPRFYGGYWGRGYWGRGFYGRGFYGRR